MNSGAPTTAVTAPTASSLGATTVRASVSAKTTAMAPPSAVVGNNVRIGRGVINRPGSLKVGETLQTGESSGAKINVGTALIRVGASEETDHPPVDPSGLSHHSLQLAEEFVTCVYANFLVTVLLRVRGLVFSAAAIYVCIIFSTISYPFEPAPQLRTLAILLFLLRILAGRSLALAGTRSPNIDAGGNIATMREISVQGIVALDCTVVLPIGQVFEEDGKFFGRTASGWDEQGRLQTQSVLHRNPDLLHPYTVRRRGWRLRFNRPRQLRRGDANQQPYFPATVPDVPSCH